MDEDNGTIEAARQAVQKGHSKVTQGAYMEAAKIFLPALKTLTEQLGEAHPEVTELRLDLEALAEMADVGAFGQEMGFRWHGPDTSGSQT